MQNNSLIILFGPNGVGKGTLASKLSAEFNFFHLNMGNLIREWIELYDHKHLNELMDNGHLVTDEIVEQVLEWKLPQLKENGNILADGFPRRKSQIKILENLCTKLEVNIKGIITLHAPLEVILERLSERVVGPDGKVYHLKYNPPPQDLNKDLLHRREDDRPEVVRRRYEEYMVNTLECLSHNAFREIEVCSIDGTRSIENVYENAKNFILKI